MPRYNDKRKSKGKNKEDLNKIDEKIKIIKKESKNAYLADALRK